MKLIVGLGNPGPEYAYTRHNIGFIVIDRLARELGELALLWEKSDKHKAMIAKVGDVMLVKPLTFMNASGIAVRSIVSYYNIQPDDVWVIHDDIDLPVGKIRIRAKGGSAGHNGVTSILEALKSDSFVRFRLGIGRGQETEGRSDNKNLHHRSVIQYVLSKFTWHQAGSMKHLINHGTQAVRMALTEGIDKAMNRFN